jgi:hypothetical protein
MMIYFASQQTQPANNEHALLCNYAPLKAITANQVDHRGGIFKQQF